MEHKLAEAKKTYTSLDRKSLTVEKSLFQTEYGYKKSHTTSRSKLVSKQIELYTKALDEVNTALKSSKNLQQFIANNLSSTTPTATGSSSGGSGTTSGSTSGSTSTDRHDRTSGHKQRKMMRRRQRRRNERLKREVQQYQSLESMLNTSATEMLEEVAKPHKSMLISTKKLQQTIGDISKKFEGQTTSMEIEFSKIARLRKSILEIPYHALSSEGDVRLYYDELHAPLHRMYLALTERESQWGQDRRQIRMQCMRIRMYRKKQALRETLQRKLEEMKKRERESAEYSSKIESEMKEILEKKQVDRFQMKITEKTAMIQAKSQALREKEELLRELAFMVKQYKVSVRCMKQEVESMEKENAMKQQQIGRQRDKKYRSLISSKKIDPETRRVLEDRRKQVKSYETTLEDLWSEMTEKRMRLKEIQSRQRREQKTSDSSSSSLRSTTNTSNTTNGGYGHDDEEREETTEDTTEDSEYTATPSGTPETMSEPEDIAEMEEAIKMETAKTESVRKETVAKRQRLEELEQEIERKKQIKERHVQSLAAAQEEHDAVHEEYKEIKAKIDGLNEERSEKFKQMFDDVLATSDKICKITQFKPKQASPDTPAISGLASSSLLSISKAKSKGVSPSNPSSSLQSASSPHRGELVGESEKSKSQSLDPEHHEPGTTPPNLEERKENSRSESAPIHLMTQQGSLAVDQMKSVCLKNNVVVNKVFDDLKHIYDIEDDLDYENTMLELRSVMDSIRNDRTRLDETFATEKAMLEAKEREIDEHYKQKRAMLKKEREKQKRLQQEERKKLNRQHLLNRVASSPSLSNLMSDDEQTMSSLSDLEEDSENEKVELKKVKVSRKWKPRRSRQRRLKSKGNKNDSQ